MAEALVYIALGSNLAEPLKQLKRARETLSELPQSKLLKFSPLYRSRPMGPQNQPDYLNAVVALKTTLPPLKLLHDLQAVERAQGRVRGKVRWGPRTLDLDLLLYEKRIFDLPELTVPHPGIASRPFVLYPLAEITSLSLWIPRHGPLRTLLQHCPFEGLWRLEEQW